MVYEVCEFLVSSKACIRLPAGVGFAFKGLSSKMFGLPFPQAFLLFKKKIDNPWALPGDKTKKFLYM